MQLLCAMICRPTILMQRMDAMYRALIVTGNVYHSSYLDEQERLFGGFSIKCCWVAKAFQD